MHTAEDPRERRVPLESHPARGAAEAGRRRAAVELATQHGAALRRVARRYSLCAADAEDAYQRTLEILLTKAPSERGRDLLAWSKTVVKHEALAVRRNRERLLGTAPAASEDYRDPVASIPSDEDGPQERLERREDVARSREALRALKPAELRALTLLAEGYTYAEIGEITGFSRTKINRCLAEGRERFRSLVSRSEDGSRCTEMALLLSPFCDGEATDEETAAVREHLRVCAPCRAAVRAYRIAPARVAVLAPALPASRSLLERAQEFLLGVPARLWGIGGSDASATQVAAGGGTRGAGAAALAKLLALCAGTVGGTAACVVTGVAPAPADLSRDRVEAPRIERVSQRAVAATTPAAILPTEEPAAAEATAAEPDSTMQEGTGSQEPVSAEAETAAIESPEPTAAPPAAPTAVEAQTETGAGVAGEFGP